MSQRIYTHVTLKALEGLRLLAAHQGRSIHLWPTPYKRSDGKDGWTVMVQDVVEE